MEWCQCPHSKIKKSHHHREVMAHVPSNPSSLSTKERRLVWMPCFGEPLVVPSDQKSTHFYCSPMTLQVIFTVFQRGKGSSPSYSFQNLSCFTLLRIGTLALAKTLISSHLDYLLYWCLTIGLPDSSLTHLQAITHRASREIQLKFAVHLITTLDLKWFLTTVNKNLDFFFLTFSTFHDLTFA